MTLLNVGYGNMVNADRIVALVAADAAPTKRIISTAKDSNMAIDATCGRKTKTAIVMDSGHVVMSAKDADKILSKNEENEDE